MTAKENESTLDLARRKKGRRSMSLYAEGEPMVWLTGGALGFCLLMILAMLSYVFWMGFSNFWPTPVVRIETSDGGVHLGTVTRQQTYRPAFALLQDLSEEARRTLERNEGIAVRQLLYTGNYDLTGTRFQWVSDYRILQEEKPEWAMMVQRRMDGNFYGVPVAWLEDGAVVTEDAGEIWRRLQEEHPAVVRRRRERERLRTVQMGRINRTQENARLRLVEERAKLEKGTTTEERFGRISREANAVIEQAGRKHAGFAAHAEKLALKNQRFALVLETAQEQRATLPLDTIVRAFPANRLDAAGQLRVFLDRWREFLLEDPREANMEGGVFPAIVGTVTMTLIMTLFVVPFGVLAALYLREYAKPGTMVSAVRISINNLAGVPSIVFGVFGLGFFCYILGGYLDEWFYASRLPAPTFRKGGVLWASLTLALLTLPVVIVATEEALSAVPGSMREGSYACGASKWQTIRRIVLPRAMPGIMTGMILAMARGAGEVAPLMLVGAVKLAPSLPLDLNNFSGSLGPIPTGPFHLERSFLHLGFHIYDLGFQSSDSEAARPMVFTTTLLLIVIIVVLNLSAMIIRTRLRRRFQTGSF